MRPNQIMSQGDYGFIKRSARPLRACMLAYTFYENDGRVIRYAEALAEQGAYVEVIALRREHQRAEEVVNGVRVLRIQRREKNERGKYSYLSRIVKFFLLSMREVTRRHLRQPYDLVHVHSVPDFEIFAALIPKLKQAKLILDIHDIVPEFYSAKFNVSQDSLVFKALKAIEKMSSAFADHVIISNDLWLETLTSRSVDRDKCSSLINYPDLSVFRPGLRTRSNDGRFIMLYPGTLNWHQGLDIAVKAVALAKEHLPGTEFHIYGEGSSEAEIRRLVEDLRLSNQVFIKPPLAHRDIVPIMANADLGTVPKRNDSFGGEAFSTKILEFMALGIPVVVADTRIDKRYFDESIVRFFKAGDEKDLAMAMVESYKDRDGSAQRAARGLKYVQENSWEKMRSAYLSIVEKLVNDSRQTPSNAS